MTLPWSLCRLENAAAHVVGGGGGGGGGSSVWGDHGTNVALSTTTITNDTAAGTAGSYSAVRGTLAHTTGKYYFEVKVLTAPASSIVQIGVMDDTTANGAAMDAIPSSTPKSAANTGFNGNHDGNGGGSGWNGSDTGAGWSLVDGDVLGYALDLNNQFGYLAKNNVWFSSGDPTSGASGTGNIANAISGNVRPAIWVFGSVGGLYKLVTATAAFTYTPPSGYSAWG
jgi:hypothetical protein